MKSFRVTDLAPIMAIKDSGLNGLILTWDKNRPYKSYSKWHFRPDGKKNIEIQAVSKFA